MKKRNSRPLTNREKSAMRRVELNEIAQAISLQCGLKNRRGEPLDTWRQLETTLMLKAKAGEEFSFTWKPARGTLRPA